MILSHVSFIKSSNARSLNLRSIHLVLMHDNRVKQCDRRVFITCQSIPNTNRVRDYTLGSEVNNSFAVLTEGKIVRILLNLLRCCIKQVLNVFIRTWKEYFHSVKDENVPFNSTQLRLVEWNIFIFHRMKIFLLLNS